MLPPNRRMPPVEGSAKDLVRVEVVNGAAGLMGPELRPAVWMRSGIVENPAIVSRLDLVLVLCAGPRLEHLSNWTLVENSGNGN